jgi:hypothetical protein
LNLVRTWWITQLFNSAPIATGLRGEIGRGIEMLNSLVIHPQGELRSGIKLPPSLNEILEKYRPRP